MNNNKEFILTKDCSNSSDALNKVLTEIGEIPLLTEERETVILSQVSQGDEAARKELFDSYLRLVVSVAKRYVGKKDFLELIEIGKSGLNKAIEKYENTKEYNFSTYATWWIQRAIESEDAN